MIDNQQLLIDLHNIEVDTIKKENNFSFRTALVTIFKVLYSLFKSKQSIYIKDLVNVAERESKKLGLEDKYDWNEIFNFKEEVTHNIKATNNTDQEINGNHYPDNFYNGTAIDNGSCFFDSFRQSLEQQKGIKVTVEQLRMDCLKFASDAPEWFTYAIANSYDNEDQRRSETVDLYTENILSNSRWGEPEVEGKILCEKYGVKLHIIESNQWHSIDDQQDQFLHQLIDNRGLRSVTEVNYNDDNVLHIINTGYAHFEPILNKDRDLQKHLQEDGKLQQEKKDLEYAKRLQQEERDYSLAEQLQAVQFNELWNQEQESFALTKKLQTQEDFALAKYLQTEEILKFLQIQRNSLLAEQVQKVFSELLERNTDHEITNVIDQCVHYFEKQEVHGPRCNMKEVSVTHYSSPCISSCA